MKCPACDYNQLRGKDGMKCLRCKRKFIFDPKSHSLGEKSLTDAYFIKCIDKLSNNGTYYYTEDELYCFMANRCTPTTVGCVIGAIVISAFISFGLHTTESNLLPIFFIAPILIFIAIRTGKRIISRKKWNKHLKRWQKQSAKNPSDPDYLTGLITSRALIHQPPINNEPDIYEYGASKLLICEHDVQVDWLILNGFHTDNGIVIISENFYPTYLKDKVLNLIKQNSELQVYTLHNTGYTGEQMINRLNSHVEWHQIKKPIIDLGLEKDQVASRVNKRILEQYDNVFPAHGIVYHKFNHLLHNAIISGVSIAVAAETMSTESSFEISGDFG